MSISDHKQTLHAQFTTASDEEAGKNNASNGVREVEELQQQVWDTMDQFEG